MTRTINIAAVARMLPVFIVAVQSQLAAQQSQEVVLLPAAELLEARVSPTAAGADGVGNR